MKLVDLEADVAAIGSLARDVASVRAAAAERDDLYELERVVAGLGRRLLAIEQRSDPPPAAMDAERVDEMEGAVVALLRQVTQLREDFNSLVNAIASM